VTRRSVRAAKRVDKSSAVVAPNVLRLTEPRSAKSSRPATISRDTGRLQVCTTGAASRLNTYKTPGYSQHVPPGQRNAATSFFFLAPRRRSGERTEERGIQSPSSPRPSPPSDGGEGENGRAHWFGMNSAGPRRWWLYQAAPTARWKGSSVCADLPGLGDTDRSS